MANQAGKLGFKKASAGYSEAQKGAGPEVPAGTDSALVEKWHDRNYNPADGAKRSQVSSELNADAGRYKKGPGPL